MWSTTLNARGWYYFDEDMYTLRASEYNRDLRILRKHEFTLYDLKSRILKDTFRI